MTRKSLLLGCCICELATMQPKHILTHNEEHHRSAEVGARGES